MSETSQSAHGIFRCLLKACSILSALNFSHPYLFPNFFLEEDALLFRSRNILRIGILITRLGHLFRKENSAFYHFGAVGSFTGIRIPRVGSPFGKENAFRSVACF